MSVRKRTRHLLGNGRGKGIQPRLGESVRGLLGVQLAIGVKKVRKYLEESLGLAEDALKPQKEVLGGMIDKVLAELAA